jgi:LytS/YehU family sensor histidine kinase
MKLSKLLRVLLYESDQDNFTLSDEINFLNDYIELMRIRVNDNVEIRFDYPAEIAQFKVPPLLFISFVENAFKHGIKAVGQSFIHIRFALENESLIAKISNSRLAYKQPDEVKQSIGISNSTKRFDLIYGENYTIDIVDLEDIYEVTIKIPLK